MDVRRMICIILFKCKDIEINLWLQFALKVLFLLLEIWKYPSSEMGNTCKKLGFGCSLMNLELR
jgi:hypothetical protein